MYFADSDGWADMMGLALARAYIHSAVVWRAVERDAGHDLVTGNESWRNRPF
jgi:hypothetical protein